MSEAMKLLLQKDRSAHKKIFYCVGLLLLLFTFIQLRGQIITPPWYLIPFPKPTKSNYSFHPDEFLPLPDLPQKDGIMKYALSFDQNYYPVGAKINCQTAYRAGFDDCRTFNLSAIHPKFYERNKSILDEKRGAGYWLWKPYLILRYLLDDKVKEGDIVYYGDTGTCWIREAEPLFRDVLESRSSVYVFAQANPMDTQGLWSKRDALLLTDCDYEACYNHVQADAAYVFFRKNEESIAFVKDWLMIGEDRRAMTDDEDTLGERLPMFRENRHDQTVLSLVAFKRHLPFHRAMDQYRHPSFWDMFFKPRYEISQFHFRNREFEDEEVIRGCKVGK